MRFFNTDLNSVGSRPSLRSDPKYRYLWDVQRGSIMPDHTGLTSTLKPLVVPSSSPKVRKGPLPEPRLLLELADVEPKTSLILQEREVDEAGSDKMSFGNCDLVISRLEPYLGKIVLNDPEKDYLGTTEWIPIKFDGSRLLAEFWRYLFLSEPGGCPAGC